MSDASDGARPSVVLVDDSRDVRGIVRRHLELSGLCEVVGEGGDGNEAISLVHRHEPALLLLDTSMPTMDGIEALPAILALCPETKVVMFTGFEEQGLAARARELGPATHPSEGRITLRCTRREPAGTRASPRVPP